MSVIDDTSKMVISYAADGSIRDFFGFVFSDDCCSLDDFELVLTPQASVYVVNVNQNE